MGLVFPVHLLLTVSKSRSSTDTLLNYYYCLSFAEGGKVTVVVVMVMEIGMIGNSGRRKVGRKTEEKGSINGIILMVLVVRCVLLRNDV